MRWLEKRNGKYYVFNKRLHHLELGLILITIGWLLILHDWFWYERKKTNT